MDIWTFDPKTGELLHGNPREAQVVWSRRNLPVEDPKRYAVPANATTIAPPVAVDGFARCFVAGAWSQVEDHLPRDPETGERLPLTVYLTDERRDEAGNVLGAVGSRTLFNELGPLPGDVTVDEPGPFDVWDELSGTWEKDAAAEQEASIVAIKAKASAVILDRYPSWKQVNMTARAVELVNVKANGGTLSAGEQAEDAALIAVWAWIKEVRSHSDMMEAAVAAGQDVDVETGAIDGAGGWPA